MGEFCAGRIEEGDALHCDEQTAQGLTTGAAAERSATQCPSRTITSLVRPAGRRSARGAPRVASQLAPLTRAITSASSGQRQRRARPSDNSGPAGFMRVLASAAVQRCRASRLCGELDPRYRRWAVARRLGHRFAAPASLSPETSSSHTLGAGGRRASTSKQRASQPPASKLPCLCWPAARRRAAQLPWEGGSKRASK